MPKIKVDINVYSAPSIYKSLQFSLLSAPKHGSKQVCSWSTCRDYLHDTYRGWLHRDTPNAKLTRSLTRRDDDTSVPDTKKLRLLITSLNETCYGLNTQETLFVGKRILNIYEELLGFSKSTITTVDYPLSQKNTAYKEYMATVWLFRGSNEWIKSPHLLSIVTLILRMAYKLRKIPVFKDNSMQEVAAVIKDFCKDSTSCTEADYIKKVASALPVVLAHHDELFTHSMNDAYDKSSYEFHSRGGIIALCTGRSPLEDLNTKIKKLLAGGNE